jgi:ABC-2 type transport system ATP-binding protein
MSEALPILSAENLSFTYPGQGRPALCSVDLQLIRGQAVGLLGPNGSGKSTLIDLLMGLRKPGRGRIASSGGKVLNVAWVPQEYAFYPELTCHENLCFFSGMLPVTAAEAKHRVQQATSSCLLHEFSGRRARQCSGGVRRRLNLAIALLQQPDVLLLDEPTVGVDPQSRAFLLEHIKSLVESGTAVLYTTHYMEEVSAICAQILLLDHGNVLASGDLASLLLHPEEGTPFDNLESLFMHYTRRSLHD